MRIAMIQHNPKVGDFEGNIDKIFRYYRSAVRRNPDIAIAPEIALWGYPPCDQLLVPSMVWRQDNVLMQLREAAEIPIIIGGVEKNNGPGMPLFNVGYVLHKNYPLRGSVKQLLPNYSVFDEKRYFEPGKRGETHLFFRKGNSCAVLVCEDIWNGSELPTDRYLYDYDPVADLEGKGVEILFVVNGSPYYWGKGNVRHTLLSGIARRLGCIVVYVNQVGGNDELVFDGRSCAFDAEGKCIAAMDPWEEGVLVFETENAPEVPYPFDSGMLKELYDALVLGVRDYIRKIGAKKVVLGLSGGIDSALVLVIAADALGPENVEAVSMPSRYTADMSNEDAKKQAEALGVQYTVIPIEEPVSAFRNVLSSRFPDDAPSVADENIQARARGNILMYISNRTEKIVLATGNKSEMSVGYATLYGDMAGGFAPIKDVYKMDVLKLAQYRNFISPSPVIPKRVLRRPPSAELAPGQRDTDSLPPYEILDPILRLYIEHDMSGEGIAAKGFDLKTVHRIIRMVDRNEFKRRQAPPGLKVTARAFSNDRRLPIAAKGTV